ncbi:MAG: glutamate-5-semialdehyde dehydrogenase [Anaerolineae bacterium]|nr:glutamate-5-semialdehyde dehydrogenase [Anaerolineae bacterium]
MSEQISLEEMGARAKQARRALGTLLSTSKDAILHAMADALLEGGWQRRILEANALDIAAAQAAGLGEALIDRLRLTPARLAGMAQGARDVAALPDPVGETFDMRRLPNGLHVGKRRTPIGVIGVIYEARPNVTIDIAALCLKTGNAVILRGGKETLHSNRALVELLTEVYAQAGLPSGALQWISSPDRALVMEMLRLDAYIDMIIPRGGAGLHRLAREHATIPVITGGIGVCHLYVEPSARLDRAVEIIYNAKVQRPSVCNALDTVLVHRDVAAALLPPMAARLSEAGVEIRCDPASLAVLEAAPGASGWRLVPAGEGDYGTEFLALILSVKVVEGMEEALAHIDRYGTGHSDGILTEDYAHAHTFVDVVDSSTVYVNASTRFTDGAQFGLGAEVAISTQRLHARGPMGLRELTTYKWVVFGQGQVRV